MNGPLDRALAFVLFVVAVAMMSRSLTHQHDYVEAALHSATAQSELHVAALE